MKKLTQAEAAEFILQFAQNDIVMNSIYNDIRDTLLPDSADLNAGDFVPTVHVFSDSELEYLAECKGRAEDVDEEEAWDGFPTSWDYHDYVFNHEDGTVPYIHAVIINPKVRSYAYKNISHVNVTIS